MTPTNSRDHVPFVEATVPRETPPSKISIVDPLSAAPDSLTVVPAMADPLAGDVITGAVGGCVSMRTTIGDEVPEVPVESLALADSRWSPSATET